MSHKISSAWATPTAAARQTQDCRFYLAMAIASTLLVFLGFARSYYLKSYFAPQPLRPLLHIHGIVFTAWMILFVAQTALIASDRTEVHRRLGYAGAFLATAMLILGLLAAFSAERLGHGNALTNSDTVFLISLIDIFTFALFVAFGFVWRRNREAHQRLMLLAVVAGRLAAAIPRLPLIGGRPAGMAIVGLGFLFAGPIYDLITRRRVHPAYVWGCLFALLTFVPVRIALAATPQWQRIAHGLIRL
jgi:uncharacterized membrane protein YozB (DUF420 family)